jgi:hypothetical protein
MIRELWHFTKKNGAFTSAIVRIHEDNKGILSITNDNRVIDVNIGLQALACSIFSH